jgi:hypothetical protein
MALKPDREEFHYDIRWYMDAPAERGGVVCLSTADSGGYPGGANNVVSYAAAPSGKFPIGVLMNDVVDYDPSRQHGNPYRMQTLIGSKVTLIKDGWVTTNMIEAADTPAGGVGAYLGNSGLFTTAANGGVNPKVGQFLGTKDQDGFAPIRIELA